MSMRRTLAIARRILHGVRRDRRTLVLLFVVPVVLLTLMGYLLRGGSTQPAVGVIQQDRGPLGPIVAQRLLASHDVAATSMSADDARADLAAQRIAGYVVLPADFSDRALRERVVAPEVHLEGTQPALSASVLGALGSALASAGTAVSGGAAPKVSPTVTYLHGGPDLDTLDYFGAAFIGLIVFFLVYVLTSIAFLRERQQGTLERLMASPLRRGEIVVGYMIGFGVLALLQSALVLAFSLAVLHIYNAGEVWLIFLLEALLALFAVNLGIFLSTFARTEFQAVQFIPLAIVPQILLSGVLFPVETEPALLQPLSNVLPLTYAVYGMRSAMLAGRGVTDAGILVDLGVGVLFAALAIALAALTLRRAAA